VLQKRSVTFTPTAKAVAAADHTAVWTWSSDPTVDFVRRRVAHECLIHRLDAQLTAQALTPIDADLATDGVDEVVTYFFSGTAQSRFRPTGPIGALCSLDTATAWVIELGQVTGPSRDGRGDDDRRPGLPPRHPRGADVHHQR